MRFYDTSFKERIGYDFYCDVAARTVEARKKKGWTQEELAEKSGISIGRVKRLESVQVRFYLNDVEKLAAALDVSADWLIEAEIDSQVGECLYLVAVERLPKLKFYQEATSRRMAFLKLHQRLSEKFHYMEPRDRAIVTLVGVPITDAELKSKFTNKIDTDQDTIEPD